VEGFIGTVVFLLPGFLMYFWIQTFGINPVVKHSPIEITAISGLLWLPVSVSTVVVYNWIEEMTDDFFKVGPVHNLADLQKNSSSLKFLIGFLFISIIISYVYSVIWSKLGFHVQRSLINIIRTWRKVAPLSKTSSVWDELFLNNDSQVVEIRKIDKPDAKSIIGCIRKASRTFEPERHLLLDDVDFFTKLVSDHSVPVVSVLVDIKSGTYIIVFDPVAIKKAQEPAQEPTSPSSGE
jgi:hypothetical protein